MLQVACGGCHMLNYSYLPSAIYVPISDPPLENVLQRSLSARVRRRERVCL